MAKGGQLPRGLFRKPGSPYLWMTWTDEHRRRHRRSCRTNDLDAARTLLDAERRSVAMRRAGVPAVGLHASGKVPIDEHLKRYLAYKRDAEGLTADHVRWNLEAPIRRAIRDQRWAVFADVTRAGVRRHLTVTLAAKHRRTVENHATAISGFCRWAMGEGVLALATNPAEGALPALRGKAGRTARERAYKRRPLWTEEIPMLLGAEPTDPRERWRWASRRAVYVGLIGTGLRRGTARRMGLGHFRLGGVRPFVDVPAELTKSGRRLQLPLRDPDVVEALDRLCGLCTQHGRRGRPGWQIPLWPIPGVGTKTGGTFAKDLARAGIASPDAEGRVIDVHSLRMTFCTQLALAGVPLVVAQRLMDHVSADTTIKHYTLVGRSDLALGLEGVDAMLGQKAAAHAARVTPG
jgi:site-specific recombinase XerD